MCNCMVLDVTAIFLWITVFLKKLPFLAKGLVRKTNTFWVAVVRTSHETPTESRASDFPRSRKTRGIRGIADLKRNP